MHKEPDYFLFHRLNPIILFDIKSNMQNKYFGWAAMEKVEELNALVT